MRCACVDIGTNTTRLLVAEHDGERLRELVARRRFVALAPGPDERIAPEAVLLAAAAVAEYAALARELGVDHLCAVATAAIRAAANGDELCAAVARSSGIAVEVLSGGDEAELAFAGALSTLTPEQSRAAIGDRPLGVADVGGGSSELVTGDADGRVRWSASLALGSSLLTARHLRSDPPTAAQLDAAAADADAQLASLRPPRPALVLAVGGSATALLAVAGERLAADALGAMLRRLTAVPSAQAARDFGVDPRRARLMPAGLLLLAAAHSAFGGAPLHIARGGLREGVALRELRRHA